jgi:hypothetical protein
VGKRRRWPPGGRRALGQGRQPGPAGRRRAGRVAPDVPLALLGAASCRDGVEQMGRDAERALAER